MVYFFTKDADHTIVYDELRWETLEYILLSDRKCAGKEWKKYQGLYSLSNILVEAVVRGPDQGKSFFNVRARYKILRLFKLILGLSYEYNRGYPHKEPINCGGDGACKC